MLQRLRGYTLITTTVRRSVRSRTGITLRAGYQLVWYVFTVIFTSFHSYCIRLPGLLHGLYLVSERFCSHLTHIVFPHQILDSALEPSHKRITDSVQRRKIGVARSHQDTNHRPCVPAFVVPAEQIIESLNVSSGLEQMHPARRVQATTTTTRSVTTSHITSFGGARQGSGANSEPVRAHNKRGMGETGMWDPLTKRMKIEEGHDRRIINEENLIDLTEDDHDTSPRFRSSRTPPRDVTDTKNRSRSDLSNIITTSRVFNKIERQLRASEAEFGEIRNVLKNQWEVDVNLQQDDVTKQLLDMNNQLTNAEVSVRNVIAVMQVIPV